MTRRPRPHGPKDSAFLALVRAGGPDRANALWWVQALVTPLADLADATDRAALEMVRDAVVHLLRTDAGATERVRDCDALRQRVAGKDSAALAILEMARQVDMAAVVTNEGDVPLAEAARALRSSLVAAHGERGRGPAVMPAEDELADWLRAHVSTGRPTRGRVTTAGIVARIVGRRRLFGASAEHDKTLKRVERIIKRHSRAE